MKKIILILFIIILSITSIYAYTLEIANTHAYYKHPVLGTVEDPGNNSSLGQGMCESVLHHEALFEEIDGQLYTTIRFNIADNLGKANFFVQERDEKLFTPVSYEIVNETEETKDYRFIIPSKTAIVRTEVFVNPMDRNVIFYMDFSDFREGSSDFIPLGETGKMSNVIKSDKGVIEVKEESRTFNIGFNHGLLMRDSDEIKAIYQNTDLVHAEETEVVKEEGEYELKPLSISLINGLVILLVIITAFFFIAFIVVYYAYKYVKELNETREEALYEEN